MINNRLLLLLAGCILTSCNELSTDISIKKDLAAKGRYELDFEGVRFTVDKRTVILNGQCATRKSKEQVESTARNLYGVRKVISNLKILPVIVGTDHLLKQAVDSILTGYPLAEAITRDSVVILSGRIETAKCSKLLDEISKLQPRKLENNLMSY